jgi:hypothetical protein
MRGTGEDSVLMKIRKPIFKRILWTMVFFLLTAGLSQGAERCKGKCCQGVPHPAVRHSGEPALSLNSKTPLEGLLPSCHLTDPLGAIKTVAYDAAPCQDVSTPACCHWVKAGAGIQALAVQGHKGVNRHLNPDMVVCYQPQYKFNETDVRFAVMGCVLHSRAASVPLYLKNTSFIC